MNKIFSKILFGLWLILAATAVTNAYAADKKAAAPEESDVIDFAGVNQEIEKIQIGFNAEDISREKIDEYV